MRHRLRGVDQPMVKFFLSKQGHHERSVQSVRDPERISRLIAAKPPARRNPRDDPAGDE